MLISCFLFASAVLANARRPQQLNLPERSSDPPPVVSVSNDRWGGAIWIQDPGTFNHIHAIFTVPNMATADGNESFAYVLVVIDGYTPSDSDTFDCPNDAMLALGLKVHAKLDGSPNYIQAITATSVDELDSNNPEILDIPISVNDDIELEILVGNATIGHVIINNLTNNHTANREVNLDDHPLCGKTAGWVVSDVPSDYGGFYTLANFGTVSFTGASAGTRGGTSYQPYGATLVRHIGGPASNHAANMSSIMTYNDGPLWIMYLDHE